VGALKRGTSSLLIGWGISLIAGYGINVWLARFLGPSLYGIYGVVMSLLLWVEIGIISGIPTAVQKFVSADKKHSLNIIKKSSVLQFFYIVVLFMVSFIAAPFTSGIFHYNDIGFYLRIALVDLWFYGFYFILLSLQNGLHNFTRQALLIALYSVSKFIFVVAFVMISGSITGAFLANIAGSIVGFSVALFFARSIKNTESCEGPGYKEIMNFAAPVALFALVINLFLNIDLWTVKAFMGNAEAGFYVSASTVARIPYFLFFALSSTVLPLLSSSISKGDRIAVHNIISTAVRFLIIAVVLIIAITAGYSREIIVLLFSDLFQDAGGILQVLICGMSFLALFFLFTTIMNADNRPRTSLLVTVIGIIIDAVLALILVPSMGAVGGAVATTLSLTVVSIIGWILIRRRFGAFFEIKSGLKIGFSGLIVFGAAGFIRVTGIAVIGVSIVLSIIYLTVLILFKEITFNDLKLAGERRQE